MKADVTFNQARILIVDDEEANLALLEMLLRNSGYAQLRSTSDSRQVLAHFLEFQPDIILLDLQMPYLDGHAILRQISSRVAADTYLPILVLTADTDPESKKKVLSSGAKDFLIKPFDRTEVLLRIRNLLETRFLHLEIKSHNEVLESTVRERTRELEETQIEILERLAYAAEFRDDATGDHTRRMGESSALIAKVMGMPEAWIDLMRRAAPLHDVGKIGIPDSILLKPDKLTTAEFEIMKKHVHIGASILSGSRSPALQMAETIALTHHERWDGTGYTGLAGDAIPLEGRIVAVADVFDALNHVRPYKLAWTTEKSVGEIQEQSGRHFDPRVVEAFLDVVQEILTINRWEHENRALQPDGRPHHEHYRQIDEPGIRDRTLR